MRARYKIDATELHTRDLDDEFRETNSATYCPEDNKIRLYLSRRVERQSYDFLCKCGFIATPKQECSFAGTWSIAAEDVALSLIAEDDDVGDEDYSPAERAADRAERFAGYRDKRRGEAHGHADRYDSGPQVVGYQNAARAERVAARHDRIRDRSLCQWSKAEYWQQRTAGVIGHALHKSDARTRRGRILEIEKRLRKVESWGERYSRTIEHLRFRLIYENAMLENEGGKASEVDMEPGGWLGRWQIHKINKSPVTKRIVSVQVMANVTHYNRGERSTGPGLETINIEKLGTEVYRAPTEEERQNFTAHKEEKPKAPPLVNPTPEAARQLQALWNATARQKWEKMHERNGTRPYRPWRDIEVWEMTQAEYAARSKSYGPCETRTVSHSGAIGGEACKIRTGFPGNGNSFTADPYRIVILTDKPQKPLPIDWTALEPQAEPVAAAEPIAAPVAAPAVTREPAPAGLLF